MFDIFALEMTELINGLQNNWQLICSTWFIHWLLHFRILLLLEQMYTEVKTFIQRKKYKYCA